MRALRRLSLVHARAAACLFAAALLMRLLVPAGFMLSLDGGRLAVILCDGFAPSEPAASMAGMHAMPGHHEPERRDHGEPERPCAFSGLSFQSLAGADPVLLAAALLFVLAAAARPFTPPAPRPEPRLRPPSRAPPVPA